jgi:NTE family protein
MLLVDGGLVNPIPIAPTLNDASAWTVAVDLNARAESVSLAEEPQQPAEPESPIRAAISRFVASRFSNDDKSQADDDRPNSLEIALKSLDTMQTTIGRMKIAAYAPRFIINVPRNLCTLFEFHRADALIEFGYQRTSETLDSTDLDSAI